MAFNSEQMLRFLLLDKGTVEQRYREAKFLLDKMFGEFEDMHLFKVYTDVGRMYEGDYPGYQGSTTPYHDLEHTARVFTAVCRLLHGVFCEGRIPLTPRQAQLALTAALFHDVGFLQEEGDTHGTGAKYTIGHENRSIAMLRSYLSGAAFTEEELQDMTSMISCTVLNANIAEITFRNAEMKLLGMIVGSADLLAQMSDRYYLEKLFLLYLEFTEAGIADYGTERELLEQTHDFYNHVVKRRLEQDYDSVYLAMRTHFKERWELDQDPYLEAIERNLSYLSNVLATDKETYRDMFRRGGILDAFEAEQDDKKTE